MVVVKNIQEEEEEEAQAEVEMWKYIFGFTNMAVIKCAIELNIFDAIEKHKQPITLSNLSTSLKCSPSYLLRIMRFLVHHNIFREKLTTQGTVGYIQTPLSRRLLGREVNSMRALFLLESNEVMLKPWHFLSAKVRDGNSPFEAAHGTDIWSYATENPKHCELIGEGMACDARKVVSKIIEKCPKLFDGIRNLVDVGGGNGTCLGMLVKAFRWIHGINFDLPHVFSVAQEFDGVTHVGGDMFQCIPKADAAFFMWVLHDWDDGECIQILKKCKDAIPQSNGKVIIVEAVIGEKTTSLNL